MRKKEYPYQNLSLEDIKGEQWKDIPELDGYYRLSDFGRVQRQAFEILCKDGKIRQMHPKMMKPELTLIKNNSVNDNVFFLRVKITLSGKLYHISIARLVYYRFVKKFDISNHNLVVLTKDGNGKNVYPDNLVLVNSQRKQKRIFERNRLIRTFYHTYDEFIEEGVEKSINPYCKQISQYTPDGRKIKTFPSIKAAAITLGISASGITSVLKERQVTCDGFVWRYGKDRRIDMKVFRENKKILFKKKRGQKITQYDLKGKKVATYLAIADGARMTGVASGDICNVLSGKQRTAGGFIWRKGWGKATIDVNNFVYGVTWRAQKRQKKVNQYTAAGKLVNTFASVKEAAAYMNVNPSAISYACTNNRKTSGGYKWRFA